MHRNEIDTWDYPWMASVWYHGGLTVTPNVNLVSNIGFGKYATHTLSQDSKLSGMLTAELGAFVFTDSESRCVEADEYVFKNSISENRLNVWGRVSDAFMKINRVVFNVFFNVKTK
jgi:hypothetical protein